MINFLKAAWRMLADLAGVISTLGLIVAASKTILQQTKEVFSENIYLGAFLLFLLLASSAYLIKTLWKNLSEIRQFWKKKKISKKLETRTVDAKPIVLKDHVPSEDFLREVLKISLQEFKTWAHDAVISSFNLYVRRDGQEISKSIQIFAISKWNKEKMVIYYPRLSTGIETFKEPRISSETFFFEYSNWERAVILAFERERNRIENDFNIQISGSSIPTPEISKLFEEMGITEEISINISFTNGQRKERVSYKYDGRNLKAEDGDLIEVQKVKES